MPSQSKAAAFLYKDDHGIGLCPDCADCKNKYRKILRIQMGKKEEYNMHVGEIMQADCANGVGIRLSLFVSGCTNRCKGCFNEQTWDFNYGNLWTPELEQFFIDTLAKPFYDGMTILGGEPFEPENQPEVAGLINRVRRELPEKNIWIYTGFVYDRDLVPGGRKYTDYTDQILDQTDILIDGPFVLEEKDIRLKFRGSRNQRILDMKQTRKSGQVVLSPLNK